MGTQYLLGIEQNIRRNAIARSNMKGQFRLKRVNPDLTLSNRYSIERERELLAQSQAAVEELEAGEDLGGLLGPPCSMQ